MFSGAGATQGAGGAAEGGLSLEEMELEKQILQVMPYLYNM